ncbi:uncharacterized protein LOC121414971 [Lytechinus variegatus]|uniref:uncharacterized protein LOC121414971 n=1 Tax=Lytechinus variegatus TaxID=7654 RepID=UPI001BB212BD|nr:uncharacterized protein LOC121414971 [Lytechinus variegatus]
MTTVRPNTAKGQRVPKPPRRLESIEVKADMKRQRTMEEISAKIKMKQEKAKLKRQALQDSRQQMLHEKSQKIKDVLEAVSEMKKTNVVEKVVEREETADAAPQEKHEVLGQDRTDRATELNTLSNELSQVLHIETSPIEDEYQDKISTYNGSDESDGDENTDYLKSLKRDDKYDEFFDGPNQESFMF